MLNIDYKRKTRGVDAQNEVLEKGEQDIIGFMKLRSTGREAVNG